MEVLFAGACQDENGKYWNGKAGDQTGKEVRIAKAYNHSYGWRIFRHPNATIAYWIGTNAKVMADNESYGYDQWQRLTGYEEAKKAGWEPKNVTTLCELDCSSMVRTAVACALEKDIPNFNTENEPMVLLSLGFYEITGTELNKLQKGDIVCTKKKGHTEVVVQGCTTEDKITEDKQKGDVLYSVKAGGNIFSEVTNDTDWAGKDSKTAITDIAIRLTNGAVKYRVHVLGEKTSKWLPYVTGCDWSNSNNGYAGNGKPIDAIGLKPLDDNLKIEYRVCTAERGWLPWVVNDEDYAGIYGQTITKIQARQI